MQTEVTSLGTKALIQEAYGKADEINLSFPDIAQLLRVLAGRMDVRRILSHSLSTDSFQRFEPDSRMHMNHEMAYMRPCPDGRYVHYDTLAAFVEQNAQLRMSQTAISLALNLPGAKSFTSEVIDCAHQHQVKTSNHYPERCGDDHA